MAAGMIAPALEHAGLRTAALRRRVTGSMSCAARYGNRGRAGKRSRPGFGPPQSISHGAMAIGAGVSVLEPGVREVVAQCWTALVPRRMQPLLGVTMLELLGMTMLVMLRTGCAEPRPVAVITPLEMARPLRPRPEPARARRVVLEVAGPRLRSQVPFGVMVMMHHLGTIAHDDADAEGGLQIRVHRAVPVRRRRRRGDGQDAERGREQKWLTHGSSPSKCSQACVEPAPRRLNDD
jgi:hypothetical protein